jgi:hypothetical protein
MTRPRRVGEPTLRNPIWFAGLARGDGRCPAFEALYYANHEAPALMAGLA